MFLARRPGARHPTSDILCVESLRRKRREERNGQEIAVKRKNKNTFEFGQNNIV